MSMFTSQNESPQNINGDFESNHDITEYLVAHELISGNDLARVKSIQEDPEHNIITLLVKLGLVPDDAIVSAYKHLYNLDELKEEEIPLSAVCDDKIPIRFQKQFHVLPLKEEDTEIFVAMAEPDNVYVLKALRLACGKRIVPKVSKPDFIEKALVKLHEEKPFDTNDEDSSNVGEAELLTDDVEKLKDLASEAPVVRFVNFLIRNAVEQRASDIHLEPGKYALKVRYRIDGILQKGEATDIASPAAVVSRIKIMANLNIAERRLPQDGRIQLNLHGRTIDLRISTLPSVYGESVVIRILDKQSMLINLSKLGLEDFVIDRLLALLENPHGILIVSGPTGSGKSTTLYSAINYINNYERKIITVEDPIEYHIDDVTQIQVMPKIDLSFANILRSVVRHDPDVIMIGEMRDLETASIAVQSALTGHLVLSTLHTNNAVGGITRLLDMGLEDYLIKSALNGIIGQRLVRVLCDNCKLKYKPSKDLIKKLGINQIDSSDDLYLYSHQGCDSCMNTGYKGRTVIMEVMLMTHGMRRLISSDTSEQKLEKHAIDEGMKTMHDHGIQKIVDGVTTIEEVLRVIH